MKNLRQQLHNIPEPSMQEKKTKKTLIEFRLEDCVLRQLVLCLEEGSE